MAVDRSPRVAIRGTFDLADPQTDPACVIRVCCTVVYRVWGFKRFLIPRNLRAVNAASIFQWISTSTRATCICKDSPTLVRDGIPDTCPESGGSRANQRRHRRVQVYARTIGARWIEEAYFGRIRGHAAMPKLVTAFD
jgi:hypothetical protein